MSNKNSPKQSAEGKNSPKPLCFVIAPIGERGSPIRKQSDTVMKYIIEPALNERYGVRRADWDANPGEITRQMILDITSAELIVCNLSGLNANVMYELGVAHSQAKKVIHIYDKNTTLPFDVRQSRSIEFDTEDPESHQFAVEQLQRFEKSLRDAKHISNPFTDAMAGPIKIEQSDLKDQTISSLMSDLEEFFERIENIERRLKIDVAGTRSSSSDKGQLEAAEKVIDLLTDRQGYQKITLDQKDGVRSIIIHGERNLDTSGIPGEISGVRIEFRLK